MQLPVAKKFLDAYSLGFARRAIRSNDFVLFTLHS